MQAVENGSSASRTNRVLPIPGSAVMRRCLLDGDFRWDCTLPMNSFCGGPITIFFDMSSCSDHSLYDLNERSSIPTTCSSKLGLSFKKPRIVDCVQISISESLYSSPSSCRIFFSTLYSGLGSSYPVSAKTNVPSWSKHSRIFSFRTFLVNSMRRILVDVG